MKTNSTCNRRRFTHALSATFLTLTAAALLALPLAVQASPELDTHISIFDTGLNIGILHNVNHTQSLTTGSSLSDAAAASPFTGVTAAATYGSASITGNLSAPAYTGFSASDAYASGGASAGWTDTYTITPTDSSLIGQTGTAQMTFRLSGSMTVDTVPLPFGWNESRVSVDGGVVAQVGYDWSVQNQFDPNVGDYATITYNQSFTFGTPFDLSASVSESLYAVNYNGNPTGALFHQNLTLSGGSFTVANGSGTAVGYSSTSNAGSGLGAAVANGGSFAGFTLTNTALTSHGTILRILGGTASVARTLNASFLATPSGISLASDVVDFSGTITDKFVLELTYDPAAANTLFGGASGLDLEWLNPATGTWVNAVFGDSDGGAQQQQIAGAYNPAADFVLGDYGVDTTNDTVWAVIDHNSQFATGQDVPEPSTWVALLGGVGMLAGWSRFGRRGTA